MFNKIKIFIYILAFVVPCLVCFATFSNKSYCASIALSNQASSTLGNSLGSVFDLSGISVSPDPVGLSIGLSQIYDRLDLYLYQNYNYDLSGTVNDTLESGVPYINQDAVLQDSFVSTITKGLYNTMQELTGYGYSIYKAATMELQNAKDTFFIGKEQNGVITEVLDNSVVYVNDDVLNAYSSSLTNAISDNALYEYSKVNSLLYGKNFHFVYGVWENYTIQFANDVVIGSLSQAGNGYYAVGVCSKYNFNENIPCSGVVVDNRQHIVDYAFYRYSTSTIVVGNNTYYCSELGLHCTDGTTFYPYDIHRYGDLYNDFRNTGTGVLSGVYSLSPDIESVIQQLLGELKGHYVSTSDLDLIIDSLTNNGVIANDDSENVAVIDWSQDFIDTLEGIIESVLERSAIYDDVIDDSNAGTPEPPINENNFYGTAIPNGFENSSWGSVFDVFKVPFNFVSFFEPLFYVFGGFSGIFAIWSVVPFVFVIMLLIWALK